MQEAKATADETSTLDGRLNSKVSNTVGVDKRRVLRMGRTMNSLI